MKESSELKKHSAAKASNLAVLWKLLEGYRRYAFVLFVIMISAAFMEAVGISLIIPFFQIFIASPDMSGSTFFSSSPVMEWFKNTLFSGGSPERRVVIFAVLVISVFALKNLLLYMRRVLTVDFSATMLNYWRRVIFKRFLNAEYESIVSENRGKLLNNLIVETGLSSRMLSKIVDYFSKVVLAAAIYAAMLVLYFKITVIISVAVLIILGIVALFSTNFSKYAGKKRIDMYQKISSDAQQYLSGVRQVKLFSMQNKVIGEFVKKHEKVKNILVKLALFSNMPQPFGEVVIVALFMGAILFYYTNCSTDMMRILPSLAFIAVASQRLYGNVAVIVSSRMVILSFAPSLKNVYESIYGKTYRVERIRRGCVIKGIGKSLLFDNLGFSYGNGKRVFSGVNLEIKRGDMAAIVGRSGSGKTTLVDILCGLYLNYEGKLMIDGTELRELNIDSWRRMIGFVSQESFIFDTTVYDNILIGNPGASFDDIKDAAKKAFADDFISELPDGYYTRLGEGGALISGGQRQRIAIARALVRKPKLLIFDEATNSLDSEAENEIKTVMESLRGDITIIVITHNIGFVEKADIIYDMEKGILKPE